MLNSRRKFCRNYVYLGLGLSFSPLLINAQTKESSKTLRITKKAQKVVKVNGKVCYEDLSAARNIQIEIWHNNSEKNPSKFEYEGKLITDSEGNYSFETDFPEKHCQDKFYNTRRIYFKIKKQNGAEILTKLHFGFDGKAFVDNIHVNMVPEKFKSILPKTKFEEDLLTVQFDIYLNAKDETTFV